MRRYWPGFDEFQSLTDTGAMVPIYSELLSDNLTPVTAFARVTSRAPHAFLLESVVGGERIARYSFIASDPGAVFEARGQSVHITRQDSHEDLVADDPLNLLEGLLAERRAVRLASLPPFVGGLVGYAAYDAVRYYESLPDAPDDDRALPDLLFGLYETMVIFDHLDKTIKVVSHTETQGADPQEAYDRACRRIDALIEDLSHPQISAAKPVDLGVEGQPDCQSSMSSERFERAVERIKEYIRAGDIFQAVLSHRMRVTTQADPLDIYRALRVVNPSPFMFYLKSPAVILVGASPEIMCRVQDRVVTNRPLAGTRPRGRSPQEDAWLERELLADPKERAEHIMLVDLGRNDVGRVAEPGSVQLSEVMSIERYSHVMHICTNVSGRLAEGKTAFDALRAALPVGTVTGAPKVRAMQIIDELEPLRRGPYAGAVGYVDFAGNTDTCIALRTMVITPGSVPAGGRGGVSNVDVQVGAGIVADSVPAAEYAETINKARGLLKAVRIAEHQLR
jgi:anthranilate synthase component 1